MAMTEAEIIYWKKLASRFSSIGSVEAFNVMISVMVKPFRGKMHTMPAEVSQAVVSAIYSLLKLDTSTRLGQECLVNAYFFTRNIRAEECNKAVYDAVVDKKLLQISR